MRFRTAIVGVLLTVWAGSAWADVCVWRDPERTMARLFPEARDYRTVVYKPTPAQVARIGSLAGQPLTPDEAREFNIYEITDGKRVIGKVLALAGPGEYGTIETVMGIGPDQRVRGVYIQRIREKQRTAIQAQTFLGQFRGKSLAPPLKIDPPVGAEQPAQVVIGLVRKMLAFNQVLATAP